MSNAMNINVGQPIGTLVEKALKNGKFNVSERIEVPIEELNIGDYVSSYRFKDSAVYARSVTNITFHEYIGKFYDIKVEDHQIKCHPFHKCLVRYRDTSNDYCVYVMRKGTAFRVGMSKIWHDQNGCGPYKRLSDEGGDAVWVLKTFKNRRDALLEECKVSIQFRLPQTMFKFKEGRGSWTQEEFEYVWSNVDNRADAEHALAYYNRNIDHPYFIKSDKPKSMKRPHETVACNILENSEMMTRDKKWVNINDITVFDYNGLLYNLSVDDTQNYYSNRILIHN